MSKHASILDAARSMFARHGYDAVSMDSVAAAAGVSKMTLYSHFADKEALFEVGVSAIAEEMIAALTAPDSAVMTLHERLTAVGKTFLTTILRDDVVCMTRSLPLALRNKPSLGARFYNAGPGRVQNALTEIMAEASARGEIAIDDPAWAANDLLSLWEAGRCTQLAFGIDAPATEEEINWRAARATALFLRACRPKARATGRVTAI